MIVMLKALIKNKMTCKGWFLYMSFHFVSYVSYYLPIYFLPPMIYGSPWRGEVMRWPCRL